MNDTVSEPFSALYTSLRLCKDKKYIRVLDFGGSSQLHQSGSSDASQNHPYELRCQLRVVDLDENPRPKFIALSYVWGQVSSKEPRTIRCGRHSKIITDNCWEALSQLRDSPDPDRNIDGSITLWVDAICINQADEEEKLHQIRLMGDIYSQAASVCVWLGPGTLQSDKVMDYLEVAGFQNYIVGDDRALRQGISPLTYWQLAFKIFYNCNIQGFLHPRNKPDRLLNFLIVGDRYLPSRDFMDEIFGRPWVSRIWTLQETLLASRIRIRCGTKSLDWSHMLYALTWFSYVLEACRTRGWHNLGLPWDGVVDTTGFERWQGLAELWMKIHESPSLAGDISDHSITTSYADSRMMADYRITIAKIILIYQVVLGSILWVIFLPLLLIYCIYKIVHFLFTILWLVVNAKASIRKYREAWVHTRYYVFSTLSSQLLTYSERHSLPTEQLPDASTTLGADLVREIWQRAATDPRDKSHGVHSVLRKLGVKVADPTPGTHCHDLYRELFIALLRWTKDSKILLCASGPKLADQPSWVPDWNFGRKRQWFNSKYAEIGSDYTDVMQLPSELFDMSLLGQRGYAGTKTSGLCHINEDLMVLYIQGIVIGTILWASDGFKETANEYTTIADDTHLRNISIFRDFYTCPSQSLSVPPGTLFRAFDGSNSSIFWTIQTMSSLPSNVILSALKKEGSVQLFYFWKLCHELAVTRRSLFRSSSVVPSRETNLYGHCPQTTQVGDILVILEGVDFPAVLRKQDESQYRLVGFAMVDDFKVMDGRVWAEMASEGVEGFEIA